MNGEAGGGGAGSGVLLGPVDRALRSFDRTVASLLDHADKRPWRGVLIAAAVCLACYLPGIAAVPPVDRTEAIYAQVSKQMAESGGIAAPRFQTTPMPTKPIGIFWLQAGTAKLLGRWAYGKIWVYRLPSLVGALLAVIITFWAVRALFGGRAALPAAVVLGISAVLVIQAHLAVTKAPLLAATVAAQWSLARLYLGNGPPGERTAAALFWCAQGAGILLGALALALLSLATVAGLVAADRRVSWLARLRPLWGVPLMLLVAAPWAVAMWASPDSDALMAQWSGDFLSNVAGPQRINTAVPPGAFVAMVLLGFLPATFSLPAAAGCAWARRGDPKVRFLLAWVLPYLAALEIVSSKPPLYQVQSVLPALAVLVALALQERSGPSTETPSRRRIALWLAVMAVLTVSFAIPLHLFGATVDSTVPVSALALAGIAGVAAALGFYAMRRVWWRASLALAAFTMALVVLAFFQVALPRLGGLWTSTRLAEATAILRRCAPGEKILLSGYVEPSAVFLTGTDSWRTDGDDAAERAAALMRMDTIRIGFVERRFEPGFLDNLARAKLRPLRLGCLGGLRYARADRVSIAVYTTFPEARVSACALPPRFRCPAPQAQ